MFGVSNPIPAHSKLGEDHFLILGFHGLDAIVIDQDGDIRTITYTDIQTEWVYLSDMDVWFNRQVTLEDMEETDENIPHRGRPADGGSGSTSEPNSGESGVSPVPDLPQ